MTEDPLRRIVVDEFSTPATRQLYAARAELGLWESEEAVIERFFPPGGRVLDLGCGTGRTTLALRERDFDVVGLDLTAPMVFEARRFARTRGLPVRYVVGDACQLGAANGLFDAALFSYNGLMQIPSAAGRVAAMAEVRRVLRPRGVFVFTALRRDLSRFDWQKRFVKHFVLQPLGLKRPEREWGDQVFVRPESGRAQFMHFASPTEVAASVRSAGLELQAVLPSASLGGCGNDGPTTFYICERPGS